MHIIISCTSLYTCTYACIYSFLHKLQTSLFWYILSSGPDTLSLIWSLYIITGHRDFLSELCLPVLTLHSSKVYQQIKRGRYRSTYPRPPSFGSKIGVVVRTPKHFSSVFSSSTYVLLTNLLTGNVNSPNSLSHFCTSSPPCYFSISWLPNF